MKTRKKSSFVNFCKFEEERIITTKEKTKMLNGLLTTIKPGDFHSITNKTTLMVKKTHSKEKKVKYGSVSLMIPKMS